MGDKLRDMMSHFEELSPEDRIKATLAKSVAGEQSFYSAFLVNCNLKSIEVLSPTSAKAIFTFKVDSYYSNMSGNLHGGAAATMYDMCTSIVLQAIGKQGFWINGGVSRVLTVNYLRPAPVGTEIEMECEVTQAGRSLAFLRAAMKRADNGAIISTCEHNKAAVENKTRSKI